MRLEDAILTDAELIALESELCRESFFDFIKSVKPDYFFNWHHLQLIDALQRLVERNFQRLVVMMPPRHGKSELVSRLFPAWCFARHPDEQVILSSYSLELASAMNRDCQRIVGSDIYKTLFPYAKLRERNDEAAVKNNHRFDIVGARGYFISAGVGGGITGAGATVGIIDDPVKNASEADSQTYRDSVWEWYTTTFKTRFEPGAVEVICQTRWHEDDLTGRVLGRLANGAKTEIISLPALCEQDEPNRQIGDALWPDKYDRQALLQKQMEVGTRAWNALYQQRPAPDEGAIIKRGWFGYYDPKTFKPTRINFYIDTAYTDKEKNDPTAAIAYCKHIGKYYVLDCQRKWLEFDEQVRFVKEFCSKNGYTPGSIVRVEPKATGKSLVQVLKNATKLNIKEGEPPKESKVSRAHSVSPVIEGGRILLPDGMAWVSDFLAECAAFPNGAHDDRVDCLTGMILSEERPPSANFL